MGLSYVTRAARLGDVDELARVHAASALVGYADIFPPEAPKPTSELLAPGWARLLQSANAAVLVAVADDTIVATAAVIPGDDVPCGVTLARLYVDPTCWRQGIGSVLHDHAVQVAAHRGAHGLNLWVLEDNHTARSMYERRGWHLIPGRTRGNDTPAIVDVLYQLALL